MNEPTVLHQHVVGLIHAALLRWTQAAPGRCAGSLPLDARLVIGMVARGRGSPSSRHRPAPPVTGVLSLAVR